MNDYYELRLKISSVPNVEATDGILSVEDAADILNAMLAETGFESFIVDGDYFVSYIPATKFNRENVNAVLRTFPYRNSININNQEIKKITGEDWNREWERNFFNPYVFGDNKCVVHSSFHKDFPTCEYDITIDPKMAFGTGHHSTTRLMVEALFNCSVKNKTVIDVGAGSAILSIIASKLGASNVIAVEIDEFAYTNTIENIALNNCKNISSVLGTVSDIEPSVKADIILANINRNIIIADLEEYKSHLATEGQIFISGFYEIDVPLIEKEVKRLSLSVNYRDNDNNWTILGITN